MIESLKIIAMAEKKMTNMAKHAKAQKRYVYKTLLKNANLSFLISLCLPISLD
jgi:DNA-binding phage protein